MIFSLLTSIRLLLLLVAVFKQSSDMTSFKEHIFFNYDYNNCKHCYYYSLQTFCLWCNRYFLLHEIDEEMEYHAS